MIEELLTGIKEIDDDHIRIFQLFEKLQRASQREKISHVIEIIEYCTAHMVKEERFMREHNYDQLSFHITAHYNLRSLLYTKLNTVILNWNKDTTVSLVICDLMDLLVTHIKTVDSLFVTFLKNSYLTK